MGGEPPGPAGGVIWLTGLSGSGKTTIATALVARFAELGIAAELLDGDAIRRAAGRVGFSREDRRQQVAAVGAAAVTLERLGRVAVAGLISPYQADRDAVRRQCRRFLEVHVATSLAECERRDPKGLYVRARAGALRHFTGIDDPYEVPPSPEVTIPTGLAVVEAVGLIEARFRALS